jgi:shikimate dehydrogenase
VTRVADLARERHGTGVTSEPAGIAERSRITWPRDMPEPRTFLSLLTGSFSTPAAGNPTVAMVEAAYRHHDVGARYINCDVAANALGDAVRGARAMGWLGFNCSLPHKVAVIDHLDGLGESAALIGAVNCVVRRDGRYLGENTDGRGFLSALSAAGDAAGEALVVLGAGGAARAIAVEAALAGAATITIVNRDRGRGADLVALLERETPARADLVVWDGTYRVPAATGVLVNATSVGLFPDVEGRLDLDPDTLHGGLIVADLIPNPPRTRLIRDAEARGCPVVDGIGMLVAQGALGIRYWTGVEPDQAVMRGELERALGV